MNRRNAFTLIELLVVISIIALLVSILLPTLAGARTQARSLICLNQLKTIGVASLAYCNDNGMNRLPYYGNPPMALKPYTNETGLSGHYDTVWRCPEDTREPRNSSSWNFPYDSSYGLNAAFSTQFDRPQIEIDQQIGVPLHEVVFASQQILYAERGMNDTDSPLYWELVLRAYQHVIDPWDRHGGSIRITGSSPYTLRGNGIPVDVTGALNFLFVDGHVSAEDKDFSFDLNDSKYDTTPWNYRLAK